MHDTDLIVAQRPQTAQRTSAWKVIAPDGHPFALWLEDKTRCWSHFSKPAARHYARMIGGSIEPTTSRTIKDVVQS